MVLILAADYERTICKSELTWSQSQKMLMTEFADVVAGPC